MQQYADSLKHRHPAKHITAFLLMVNIATNHVLSRRAQRLIEVSCHLANFKDLFVVTTMWDIVTPEVGLSRLNDLRKSFHNNIFRLMFHDGTHQSAIKILRALLGHWHDLPRNFTSQIYLQWQRADVRRRKLVHMLTTITNDLKIANDGAQVLDALNQQNLDIVRAAITSEVGIPILYKFAEAGHHNVVVNVLDAVSCI